MSAFDDSDPAEVNAPPHGDAILVAGTTPESEAVAAALRAQGFSVSEAPVTSLVTRALAHGPRVIVVDVDQPGAVEAVERLRELAPAPPAELVCLGSLLRAAELGATRDAARAFERSADVGEIVAAISALAEPISRRARGLTTPPPPRRESDLPFGLSDFPSAADPLDYISVFPSVDETAAPTRASSAQLSPELEQLLRAAEQRVASLDPSASAPAPEGEGDFVLPPEMLAYLDDPLDSEDDGTGTTGTSPPHGQRQQTAPGAGGTGSGMGAALDTGAFAVSAAMSGGARGHLAEPLESRAPYSLVLHAPNSAAPDEPSAKAPRGAARDLTPPLGVAQSMTSAALTPPRISPPPSTLAQAPTITPSLPIPSLPLPPRGAATIQSRGNLAPPATPPSISIASLSAPAERSAPTIPGPPRSMPEPAAPPPAPPPSAAPAKQAASGAPRPPLPVVLGEGDAVRALAWAVASRASGSLALGPAHARRRIVLHDGDIVTAASTAEDEALLAFLVARGDLPRDDAAQLSGKLPSSGRHAGAALIAHGHLGQDDLWPVLRAHAEWIIGRALLCDEGTCELEAEPPGRLKAEPGVFGGATGAEVLVEALRRAVPPEVAQQRLGGSGARLDEGERRALLAECALGPREEERVRAAAGRTIDEVTQGAEPELVNVLYALVALGVLRAHAPARPIAEARRAEVDPLDEEAIRKRVRARLGLVEEGDYFAVLGIPRSATSYEIRRAYLELRRAFEPARLLTARTADLAADLRLVIEVLDEAYDILREPHRRERYRKAIEAGPP